MGAEPSRHRASLLCGSVASPSVLCAVWGATISERYKTVREYPKEGYGAGEGSRGKTLEE